MGKGWWILPVLWIWLPNGWGDDIINMKGMSVFAYRIVVVCWTIWKGDVLWFARVLPVRDDHRCALPCPLMGPDFHMKIITHQGNFHMKPDNRCQDLTKLLSLPDVRAKHVMRRAQRPVHEVTSMCSRPPSLSF